MTYNTASGAFAVAAPISTSSSTIVVYQNSGTYWGITLSNTYTNQIAGISIGGGNNTTTSSFGIYQSSSTAYINNQFNGPMNFYTNNAQRMSIASDGSINISPPSNDYALVVNSTASNYGFRLVAPNTLAQSYGAVIVAGTTTTDYPFVIQNASASNMFLVNGAGNVTIAAPTIGSPLVISAGTTGVYPGVSAAGGYGAAWEFAGNGNALGSTSLYVGQNGSGVTQIWSRANAAIDFNIGAGGTLVGQFNSSGGLTIPSPTSGYGLKVSAVASQPAIFVNGRPSLGSFTGNSPLGLMVGGAASTTDYSGIDFVRTTGTNALIPFARIAAIFGASSSQLSFGLSTSTSYSGGTGISVTAMTINALGAVTAVDFVATSDATLKNVTGNIKNALEKVELINGVNYYWNDLAKNKGLTDETLQLGVLAQEVQLVAPEAVHENNGILSVSYDKLVPILIEAIKELSKKVDSLTGVK